jgi:hypothetical protein
MPNVAEKVKCKNKSGYIVTKSLQMLVYDTVLKAPACVLLQAAFGCGSDPAALKHFKAKHWLLSATPGMLKWEATPEEWAAVAVITERTWGDKSPHA